MFGNVVEFTDVQEMTAGYGRVTVSGPHIGQYSCKARHKTLFFCSCAIFTLGLTQTRLQLLIATVMAISVTD